MRRALRTIDHLDRRGLESRALRHRQQSVPQFAFRQGSEPIEQRQNQLGVPHQHQELEREQRYECPNPPALPHPADQRQHQPKNRKTDRDRQRQPLELIRDPESRRALVEAEALLHAELRPPFKRHSGHRQQQPGCKNEQGIIPLRGARREHRHMREEQRQESTKEDERQYSRLEDTLQHVETLVRQGVLTRPPEGRGVHDRQGGGRRRSHGAANFASIQPLQPEVSRQMQDHQRCHHQNHRRRCHAGRELHSATT